MLDKSASLMIIEDHAIVREAMTRMLQESGFTSVMAYGNLSDAILHMKKEERTDLALVDLNLPDSSGLSTIEAIRAVDSGLPILLITAETEINIMKLAFNLGVMGFVPKTVAPPVIMAAIELVLSGGTFIPKEMLVSLHESSENAENARKTLSDGQSCDNQIEMRLAQLTPRQKEVSHHLLMGRSNKEIARIMNISPGTVRIHISAILRVLQVRTRAKAFYFLNSKNRMWLTSSHH